MAWTAGDYALIITTATTAVTAIAGVGLPLWRDYVAKRDQQKEETYRRVSEAVYFCVEHIDDVIAADRNLAFRVAFKAPKKEGTDEVLENVVREFSQKLAIIELIAAELGVFTAYFLLPINQIRSKPYEYGGENDRKQYDNSDVVQVHLEAKSEMIIAAARLLRETRLSLGIKAAPPRSPVCPPAEAPAPREPRI